MEAVRLQKYISDCGIMSRRAAEREIVLGRITVNGENAELGQKIIPGEDIVKYNGETITRKHFKRMTYIMLNKPVGYITTMSDEYGRHCVAELVENVGERVYPVGRLDYDSEGLLLLTNDGDLTYKLTHPKYMIPKIYHIKVDGEIMPDKLKLLSSPMEIDGYVIKPVETEIITRKEGFTVLRMTLIEGRNRQIRKMCEIAELEILNLRRIAVGMIKLGDLKPGRWRRLTASQVEYLKRQDKPTKTKRK